jgi:hypothetical protein
MKLIANTSSYFGLFIFLYLLIFVLAFSFLGEIKYVNKIKISDPNLSIHIIYFSIQAFIGFLLGLAISGFKKYELYKYQPNGQAKILKAIYLNTLFSIAILLGFFSIDIFIIFSNYQSNYSHSFNASSFSFLKINLYVSLSLLVGYYMNNNQRVKGYILFLAIFLLGFFTSDKNPIVLGLLGVFSSFPFYHKKIKFKYVILIIFCICAVLVASMFFSLLRVEHLDFDDRINFIINRFRLSDLDGAGPYYSILYFLENPSAYFGLTYVNDILGFIPQFLYTDRPDGTALLFAKTEIKDWSAGQGLGFSPVAEGINNFGYHGVILHFFIIGIIWGWWWSFIRWLMKLFSGDKQFFIILYRVVGIYSLLLIFRGSGLGFIKSTIYAILPILVFLMFLYLLPRTTHNEKQ